MGDTADYLKMFAGLPLALRRYLRQPLTVDEARRIVTDRLEHREDNFLRIVEQAVYGNPASPYLALLRLAGCDLADLRALVKQKGLEGALRALRRAGVYVTFEEFKGRKPIVRGGATIPVTDRDFDNPFARRDLTLATGGSTGRATAVHQDLDYLAALATLHLLMLHAWGVHDAPAVVWAQILPGAGMRFVLLRARFARLPETWYSNCGWFDTRSWLKCDLATLYNVFWLRTLGGRVEFPKVVGLDRALVVARRMRQMIDEHGQCLLYTSVSRGLRVAVAAEEAGVDLTGATIRVGGEPVTAAKVERMRRVGARVMPAYGSIEAGAIGLGCPRPSEIDHMHLASDAVALITHPLEMEGTGVTVQAFNLTSLVDASPKVMLNYQIDDDGIVEERNCGCPLHACGYTTSLHTVRSYSKLLVEAVTLIGTEIQRILEEALPARFGGSPLDYQLMEREDAGGVTRLNLLISPRLSIPDEQEVVRVFLRALRASSPLGDAGGSVWEQADTLRVLRQEPVLTHGGKMMPLYHRRSASGH
jgi:hypothetical protein